MTFGWGRISLLLLLPVLSLLNLVCSASTEAAAPKKQLAQRTCLESWLVIVLVEIGLRRMAKRRRALGGTHRGDTYSAADRRVESMVAAPALPVIALLA